MRATTCTCTGPDLAHKGTENNTMTNMRALGAVIILSAAVATSAFAKDHGRAHDRYRRAYNQLSVPYDAPANGFGFSGRESSPTDGGTWLHPGDLHPSGS